MNNQVHFTIGFHTAGSGGNPTGIGDFIRQLDWRGIPASITCVDGDVGISDAIALINAGSPVRHNLMWRLVTADDGTAGGKTEYYAVPRVNGVPYGGTPEQAGEWIATALHQFAPPTVKNNKTDIWVSVFNEVDKNQSGYLGKSALKAAQLLNGRGYKVMAFGFASGEPEQAHWETEGMLSYLRYCASSDGMAGVALHEYSYDPNSLFAQEGYLVFRFKQLFRACEQNGIDWSKIPVFIKEFGYTHEVVPAPAVAKSQLERAANEYARYPNIQGVTLWYLGPDYGNIADKVNAYIPLVGQLAMDFKPETIVPVVPNVPPPPVPPVVKPPRIDYPRTYVLIKTGESNSIKMALAPLVDEFTIGPSADDAGLGAGLLTKRTVKCINPLNWYPELSTPAEADQAFKQWFDEHYPGVIYDSISTSSGQAVYNWLKGQNPPPPPPPPPPSGEYTGPPVHRPMVRGVDQPASDWHIPAWNVFVGTGLSPKFHTGGVNPSKYPQYKHPVFNPVRVLLNPAFVGNAQHIFTEIQNEIAAFYNQGARDFILLNEPNIEGMGFRWNSGREFGLVFTELCQLVKAAFAGIRIWFPGCSPQFGGQHLFIEQAIEAGAFTHIYGICEHVYTGDTVNQVRAAQGMFNEVMDFRNRYALARPLMIGEFSVNKPASADYKARVYKLFYNLLGNVEGVAGAYSFTASWFPHESPDNMRNQESWHEMGIDNHFRGL